MAKAKKKKQTACKECTYSFDMKCTHEKASGRKQYPYATRRCTGYEKFIIKEPPFVPVDYAILVVRKNGVQAWIGPTDKPGKFSETCKPIKHIAIHSPDGFEYGYGGSGPADLAYAILTEVLGESWANLYYQAFKNECVAKQTANEWIVTVAQVYEWWKESSKHLWRTRVPKDGKNHINSNIKLPTRCSKCGTIRRKDGKDKPCRVPSQSVL